MKIAIVLNRQTGQLDITWPNDETHRYIITRDIEHVDHKIRDAVADTMQDLIRQCLIAQPVYSPQAQSRRRLFNEGAGDLQLGRTERKPLGIDHVTIERSPWHKWVVLWDDGSIEDIHDADHARQIAEAVHVGK